jgi:hypothetical protein
MIKHEFFIATVFIWALASGANAQPSPTPDKPSQPPAEAAGARGTQGQAAAPRDTPGRMMGGSMMSDAERKEHHRRMMSFRSAKECRAYVNEHHRLMMERARQAGRPPPAMSPHDPCVGLK